MVEYQIDSDGKYVCECGEFVGSRSGWYKHKTVKHSTDTLSSNFDEESTSEQVEVESEIQDGEEAEWLNWSSSLEDDANQFMPTPLKSIYKKGAQGKRTKRNKEDLKSARDTSKSLAVMGLTFGDTVLSVWGRGVLIDPEFKVKHSDRDKELVADSVVGAMEEKGIYLADSISRTTVAGLMLGWYFGVPTYQISKKAKRGLFKGGRGSGILSKIPIVGRLFRKKKKNLPVVPAEDLE